VNKSAEWVHNFIVPAALLLLPLLTSIIVALWILQVLFGMGACASATMSRFPSPDLDFKLRTPIATELQRKNG
jgi:hypothetical protein